MRHAFRRNDELARERSISQFGRAMRALGRRSGTRRDSIGSSGERSDPEVFVPGSEPTPLAVRRPVPAAQATVKYHSTDHQAHPLGYIVDGALKIDLDIKPQI